MKLNKTLLLMFYLLAGIVIGNVIAQLFSNISFLSWLSYYSNIGFEPFMIDLSVLKVTFGMNMGINVAQIITISVAIFIYKKTVRR